MRKSRLLGTVCACVLCISLDIGAAPILYDFNFDTGSDGFVTGQFIADPDGQDVNSYGRASVISFEFSFLGVIFDTGSLEARSAQGYTDFTGLQGTIYSSSTIDASLRLNTFYYVSSIAEWEYIPGYADGYVNLEPQFAVSVAAVPIPASVWLFGSGLLGLIGIARRRRTS